MKGHKILIRSIYLGGLIAIAYLALSWLSPSVNHITPLSPDEKATYIEQLEIYEFFADRIELSDGHRQPAIWFRLKNNSDKSITSLKVKISFFDNKDKVIHESFFHPVHGNTLFSQATERLEPGAIWQMSHSRYYIPTNVPNVWRSGKASAQIVDIEIDQQS
jgi:hypothetical protein